MLIPHQLIQTHILTSNNPILLHNGVLGETCHFVYKTIVFSCLRLLFSTHM